MHALVRKMSAYTSADVVVGVFTTESRAIEAAEIYRLRYEQKPELDPWSRQAYRPDGPPTARELVIESLPAATEDAVELFLVSRYEEGFGQIIRILDSLHISASAAQVRIREIDSTETDWPTCALVQAIEVDTLLSDEPNHQPKV